MIKDKETNQQKKVLMKKRNEIVMNISRKVSGRNEDNHLASGDELERASVSNEYDMSFYFDDRRIQQLRAVDKALKKIDRGEYGLCEMCGKKIGKKRLLAMPLTPFCRVCQSEIE